MHRKLVKCLGAAMVITLLATGCTFSGNSGNTNKGETVTESGSDAVSGNTSEQGTEKEKQTDKEKDKEMDKQTAKETEKTGKESDNNTKTESQEAKDTQEARDTKQTEASKENKDGKENKDSKDAKESNGTQDSKDNTQNNEVPENEETKAQGPVVAVDAGHQGPGQDMSRKEANGPGSEVMKARLATGTTGSVSGLDEYELNLDVSLKLQTELEKRGYQVVMTRTTHEVDLGNIDRATIANEAGADILVRIHANGSEDSSVAGALTMAPTQSNPYVGSISEECMRLSQSLIDSYCEATGLINRGILAEDEMTGINWSQIPVTILEMGFMTNPGDDAYMANSGNQDVMVQGIANGIDNYFGR